MSDTKTSTAIAPVQYEMRSTDIGDTFADPNAFAHWQRVASMFAASEVIPQHLRGHLPDVLIGLDLARRLNLNPLSVLQNLYVVKGTPGWKTTFLIALANQAGWDLDWQVEELVPRTLKYRRKSKDGTVDAEMDNLRVRCTMTRQGKTKVGMWISSQQAIAARWADNEQYTHSAELMLRYRSASSSVRLFDPNVLLGLPTAEEAADLVEQSERIVITPPPAARTATVERGATADLLEAVSEPDAPTTATEPSRDPEPTPAPAAEEPAEEKDAELVALREWAKGEVTDGDELDRAAMRAIGFKLGVRQWGRCGKALLAQARDSFFVERTRADVKHHLNRIMAGNGRPPEAQVAVDDMGREELERYLSRCMDVLDTVEGR